MYYVDYNKSLKYKLFHIKYLSIFFKVINYLLEYDFLSIINKINIILKKLLYIRSMYLYNVLYLTNYEKNIQKNTMFLNNVNLSIIIFTDNINNCQFKKLIMSIINQTSNNWELHIVDKNYNTSERLKYNISKNINIHYYNIINNNISDLINNIIINTNNNYIGFLNQHCFLHPSAVFEILNVFITENSDLIYSNEIFYCNNKIINLSYNIEFSFDSLRSFNYINNLLFFKKNLYINITNKSNYTNYNEWYYDLLLKLAEKAQIIKNISKLLCFIKEINNTGSRYLAINNDILSDHFSRLKINANIKETSISYIKKIEYEIINKPLISILIPTMDHIEYLEKCILSILNKTTYKNYEIVLIENNSKNEYTFNYYKSLEKYKNIKVIFSKYNHFNFSAIINFGFKYTSGEYIILLNNDIEIITTNWIQEMLMFAQNGSIGIVGAKLYYSDNTIQHAGIYFNKEYMPVHNHRYFHKNKTGNYYELVIPRYVSAVTGACLMISSSAFKEVNGLDEQFEIGFNDIDLCMKIKERGYSIIWTPYAEAYHYESKSLGYSDIKKNNKYNKYIYESNIFLKKWKSRIINEKMWINNI